MAMASRKSLVVRCLTSNKTEATKMATAAREPFESAGGNNLSLCYKNTVE